MLIPRMGVSTLNRSTCTGNNNLFWFYMSRASSIYVVNLFLKRRDDVPLPQHIRIKSHLVPNNFTMQVNQQLNIPIYFVIHQHGFVLVMDWIHYQWLQYYLQPLEMGMSSFESAIIIRCINYKFSVCCVLPIQCTLTWDVKQMLLLHIVIFIFLWLHTMIGLIPHASLV